jgi:hypothetical protein
VSTGEVETTTLELKVEASTREFTPSFALEALASVGASLVALCGHREVERF